MHGKRLNLKLKSGVLKQDTSALSIQFKSDNNENYHTEYERSDSIEMN